MRYSPNTSYLKYRLVTARDDGGPTRTKNCEFRSAGASYFVANNGDDDGLMGVDTTVSLTENAPAYSSSPLLELINDENGKNWVYMKGSASAGINNPEDPILAYDVRTVGLECYPLIRSIEKIRNAWAKMFLNNSHWRVEEENELISVLAEREIGDGQNPKRKEKWCWRIDPTKGYALISLEIDMVDPGQSPRVWGRCDNEYVEIDGHWFPKRSKSWRYGRSDEIIRAQYELIEGSFNRNEHPKRLTPQLLGIPAGAWIGGTAVSGSQVWDGSRSISLKQWLEYKKASGNREPLEFQEPSAQTADQFRHPAWWYDENGKMGLEKNVELDPDSWEKYVRRWCLRNNTNEQQRTNARAILDDSRKLARGILEQRRTELDKIEVALRAGKMSEEQAALAKAEKDQVLSRVSEIFERLKARLEALLLQKQISAKQATSAPAAKPN